jgi:Domain of unknown function (DUF5658)
LLDTRFAPPALPRRLLWTWLALLALSQLADVATTWHSLAGGLREDNPFVAAALATGNFGLFALVKVLLVAALGVAVLGGRPVALNGARLVVAIFVLVALANLLGPLLS